MERLKGFFENKKVGPYTLDLKPTNKCNLNCIFCPTKLELSKLRRDKEISDEEYLKLVEEAAKFGVKEVYIGGGGEPLLRKELTLTLMKLIKKKGMEGFLITNGTLFNKEDIQNIILIGWDNIHFSIDGADSKINDYLRGKTGTFKSAIRNLILFKKLKKSLNKENPNLHIATVLVNKNYKQLPKFVKLAYKLGIDSFILQKFVSWTKKHKFLELNNEQIKDLARYFDKAKKLSSKLKIDTNIEDFENIYLNKKKTQTKKDKKFFCSMPFLYFCVRVNGDVQPCMSKSDIVVGNIKKESFKELWFGKGMEDFRESLFKGKKYAFCRNCCARIMNKNFENKNEFT